MPKMKTNKAMKKRFRVTKTGKITFKRAGSRHLKACKNGKKVRQLRVSRVTESSSKEAKRILRLLGQ